MITAKPYEITSIANSFPETPGPEIRRENILDMIDTLFISDTKLIVIEGNDGIGRTNLLSQFVRRHSQHAMCLFLTPIGRWGLDPNIYLLDLANQLNWLLHHEELDSVNLIESAFFSGCIHELVRRARRGNCFYYFVVDGLSDLLPHSADVIPQVLSLLPPPLTGFRFLFSGRPDQLDEKKLRIRPKPFPLPGFTLDETIRLLEDVVPERKSLEDIHRVCKGIPAYLSSVRRILQAGTDIDTFLKQTLCVNMNETPSPW